MASIRQAWRNPLARSADRVEATTRMFLTVLWVLALPFFVVLGSHVWQDVSATAQHQQQSRQLTTAQLLAALPTSPLTIRER
jgi:hypothetical protein